MQDLQSLVFTFRNLYVVLFLHYRVQVCKCVFEIRQYHPAIMKKEWKERVQNALYFGIFTWGVDSSCNKDSGWRQLAIHVVTSPWHQHRQSRVFYLCPRGLYSQEKEKLYVQKLSVLPGNGCAPSHQDPHSFPSPARGDEEQSWPWMVLPMAGNAISASPTAGCWSEKQRGGEQPVQTYPWFLA